MHPRASNFQPLIQNYNKCLSFTSFGAKIDHTFMGPKGINCFRISGIMTHKIPGIEPGNPNKAVFTQIFVLGNHGKEEAHYRIMKAQGKGKGAWAKLTMDVKTVKRL
ncbi:hypothetical protein PCASD_09583 [Puccinia coronata f. sp. avenae]|uniref:Uncharacterized protein n=1 Tax=Puccinia coronata f. sp. avenae TaxID=200324 RepID=A0A2N5V2J0_9BASI|nr:hypothetical protein PCASD_09583 [Puccinia coronata f. sp. avenae]